MNAIRDSSTRRRSSANLRCMGTALEISLNMQRSLIMRNNASISQNNGRMILFLSGHPNYGSGALASSLHNTKEETRYYLEEATDVYRNIAKYSLQMQFGIDIFCAGNEEMCVPMLHRLSMNSGGSIVLQRELEREQLSRNVCIAMNRVIGVGGIVDTFCSKGMKISSIIGPAAASSIEPYSEEGDLPYRLSVPLSSVQSRLALSILYQISDDIYTDHVYFQYLIHFTNKNNQRVLRVITTKIQITSQIEDFISSINTDAIITLMAKNLCLFARRKENSLLMNHLDQCGSKIIKGCGKKSKDGRYVLSPALNSILRRIFLLRRGPVLGPLLQHIDDIDWMRCLLLYSNISDSIKLIDPPLFMVDNKFNMDDMNAVDNHVNDENKRKDDNGLELYQVPSEDVAMQSDKILLLDHYTDVFQWLGHLVPRCHHPNHLQCQSLLCILISTYI